MNFRQIEGDGIVATVIRNPNGKVHINGQVTKYGTQEMSIRWMAAKEAHRGTSFSGSGLPYHSPEQAFDNSSNKGLISSPDGSFGIELGSLPGAYYTGLGSIYVPPTVMFEISTNSSRFRTHLVLSEEGMPFRWIAGSVPGPRGPQNENEIGRAMFYSGREDLGLFQNQEAILRYKGYPSREAEGLPERLDAHPWFNATSPS
jgi:hypothetical protein